MLDLTITDESIDSNGVLSVLYAAGDELQHRYGGDGDDAHLHVDDLRGPLGLFLVARVDGELVGGVGLRPIGDPAHHLGEIKRLWVRPDLRRRGIAGALMSDVEERARAFRYERLYLETGWMQPEALQMYQATGWKAVKEYPQGVFAHPKSQRFTRLL